MSNVESLSYNARQTVRRLTDNAAVWIISAIICCGLAFIFAMTTSRPWEASQAVVVRQETNISADRPGHFADLYEMRTLQETILELAKSRQVIAATLMAVEAAENGLQAIEPSDTDIAKFRKQFMMLPPGGAEFGKTEVFYLRVKNSNRQRALNLVSEVTRQLDARLQTLRNEQGLGLVRELTQQVQLAEDLNRKETERLSEFEAEVGSDLGELRMLHSSFSGQSDLRQQFVGLETDARRFQTEMRDSQELLELLQAAQNDPLKIVATPNSLLASQPALRRLKDGLIDAQLASARLQGTRSAEHPRVLSAQEAEARIRRDLYNELQSSIEAAQAELELNKTRHTHAKTQLAAVEQRLAELAEKRAEYSNRVAALETSRQTLDRVKQQLNASQASLSAGENASVLTPLDEPETGPGREGLGLATTSLAGLLGGLSLGVGLVLLGGSPSLAAPGVVGANRSEENQAREVVNTTTREWWETAETSAATAEAIAAGKEKERAFAEAAAQREARLQKLKTMKGLVNNSPKNKQSEVTEKVEPPFVEVGPVAETSSPVIEQPTAEAEPTVAPAVEAQPMQEPERRQEVVEPAPSNATISTPMKTLLLNPGVLPTTDGKLDSADGELTGMSLEEVMNAAAESR